MVVPGSVVVVECSGRVPPGLLSFAAWEALRRAVVLTGEADHPQVPALRDAGIAVEVAAPSAPALLARAAAGEHLVWLSGSTGDEALVRALGTEREPVQVIVGSYDPPGARLLDVVAVMDRLRSPGGCPWDAAQTHTSLMPHLIEEAYEAYQALEDGDPVDLREELGDVLLQVVFHARLAQEHEKPWGIDEVAGDLVDKLVRRHPHVFAGTSADDLEGSWEALKRAEKGRTSVTEGVPLAQPALLLAATLQKRAARLGAPLSLLLPPDTERPDTERPDTEPLGDQLWALVGRCRAAGLDPEVVLRATARRFRDRLAAIEAGLLAEGIDAGSLTQEQWRTRWTC